MSALIDQATTILHQAMALAGEIEEKFPLRSRPSVQAGLVVRAIEDLRKQLHVEQTADKRQDRQTDMT